MKSLWHSLIIFIYPWVNDFPQDSHLKSLQPSWTVLNHLLIWPAQVNIFFHNDYNWEFCKSYWCKSCGNLFSEEGTLKKHIHTVLEFSKDYKCESCGKSFPDGGKLKRHIKRVHERIYAAQNSNVKFVKKKLLETTILKYTWKMFMKN